MCKRMTRGRYRWIFDWADRPVVKELMEDIDKGLSQHDAWVKVSGSDDHIPEER